MAATYVRLRKANGDVVIVPVLASFKHPSGHVFLIHKSEDTRGKFCATYGPVGLRAGDHATIEAAIANVAGITVERVEKVLTDNIAQMERYYFPALGSEYGIEHAHVWRAVEQSRFDSGEYKAIPVLDSLPGIVYPAEHYLHLAVNGAEDDYVAYTPSESYGQADRQVRLRLGRYLHKTFSQLSDSTIQSATAELRAKLARKSEELHFATDIETINRIFETKMYACHASDYSCMYGKWDGDTVRPYHVYADSPDVAVAYMTRDDRIIARSVVSTRFKRWVRAYSVNEEDDTTCNVLTQMLQDAGYSKGDLEGSRLTKRGMHMPYLDGDAQDVNDDGKYWIVVESDGEYTATETNGTMEANTPRCSTCDNREDSCECSWCNCCEERYAGGCDTCDSCSRCGNCVEHDRCSCERCSRCHELTRDCECEHCERCDALMDDCDCPPEEEENYGNGNGNRGISLNIKLDEMLKYRRPSRSATELAFIKRYIDTIPGMITDQYGNRVLIEADSKTMISVHTDTVHRKAGMQRIHRTKNEQVSLSKFELTSNCLGADDTAGVYAALCMIQAGVKATYVFHRDEEIGGRGSAWLAKNYPGWLKTFDRCVALDRRGTQDVITHQSFGRCCSDGFAWTLATALDMGHLPSDKGIFTDSANYVGIIPECTNLSVGYEHEHTEHETLNTLYLEAFIKRLIAVDWNSLPTNQWDEDTWTEYGMDFCDYCSTEDSLQTTAEGLRACEDCYREFENANEMEEIAELK